MPMPRKPDPIKHCPHCKARMTRRRFRGRLEDLAAFRARKYCDRECMALAYVNSAAQPNSKRRRVWRSRGTSCEVCGGSHYLAAHHIDGDLDNDSPENIQTLCASCHATHHHRVRRAGLTVPGRMEPPE